MRSKTARVGFALLAFAVVLAIGGLGTGDSEPPLLGMYLGGLGFLVVLIGALAERPVPPPSAP
ncbi:MAG: hypothetical protein KY455_02480 [Euryarchaeota archaeon]|nr:hypothetical protein [Euryarchaeota archaeon]